MKMPKRWNTQCATMLTLVMAVTVSWGQDGAGAEKENKSEDPEPVPIKWNSFSIGYNHWSVSDNEQKLRQYATPSRDFDVRELRYTYPGYGVRPFGRIVFKGIPKNDNIQEGQFIFLNGRANLKFGFDRREFYDATPIPVTKSFERNAEASLSYTVTPEINAWVAYKNRVKDLSYEAPKDNTATVTRTVAAGIEGNMLGGHSGLTLTERRFYDRNDVQPTTIHRRIDLFYGKQFTPTLNVEGVYSNTRIQQRGFRDSNVRNWALNGDWDLGPDTSLELNFRREDLNLPNTQSDYVRKRFAYSARVFHQFNSDTSAQVGFEHREAERIRSDQTFVDVPKWNAFDARFTGRLGSSGLRYSLRGSWEHLNQAALMVTDDPRSLYWDDRVRFQAKVDYTRDRFSGYASYQYRFDQNTPRDVEVTSHNLTLGGSYTFNEQASGFIEFAHQSYRASGVIDGGYDLDWFFPSSTSIGAGFTYAINPATSVSLALTHFVTNNDNPLGLRDGNVRNTELTATFRRQINANNALELVVAPWTYRDRLSDQMGYRSTMIGVNWTVKF